MFVLLSCKIHKVYTVVLILQQMYGLGEALSRLLIVSLCLHLYINDKLS